MDDCKVCGGTSFYLEDGFYFCDECQTQHEDKREEILELRTDGMRLRKKKIPKDNSAKSTQETRWTTWEQYNFILIGLTNELIQLGASPDIKLTILQLWAFYLGKIEVAFTSTEHKTAPKLARTYHKKDAAIIYGKIQSRKRKRKSRASSVSRASSLISGVSSSRDLQKHKSSLASAEYERFVASQDTANSDAVSMISQGLMSIRSNDSSRFNEQIKHSKHAKAENQRIKKLSKKLPPKKRDEYLRSHVTTKYRTGPYVITPLKLWSILYLALRIHNEDVHLADMLRYGREGHLSYYKLDHLLPDEMVVSETDVKLLTQTNVITHKGVRRTAAELAKFLYVHEIYCPNFVLLTSRYCRELQLPSGILTYVERLVALSPPKMEFNARSPTIPNYEGRAMAYVIVVLKLLFGMDGVTEFEISRIAELTNSKMQNDESHVKLFSFTEWQRYIECRKTVLMDRHFPTKFKYDSDAFGGTDLYVSFIKSAISRRDEKPEITDKRNGISMELRELMEKFANMIGSDTENANQIESFPPSLTPMFSYLEQLLDNPMHDLPDVLRCDFSQTKISYLTKPKKFVRCMADLGVQVRVVKSRLHFLQKLMPRFTQSRTPIEKIWNADVNIELLSKTRTNFTDYAYANEYVDRSSGIELDSLKLGLYESLQTSHSNENEEKLSKSVELSTPTRSRTKTRIEQTPYSLDAIRSQFGRVGPDGKLHVGAGGASAEKTSIDMRDMYDSLNIPTLEPKVKQKLVRNEQGRFVSDNAPDAREEPEVYRCPRKRYAWSEEVNEDQAKRVDEYETNVGLDQDTMPDDSLNLFVPARDYWMYHCIFSRIKPKYFETFEANLPVSFRWLLNESAEIVEMSTEDLYEEVCLIETYFAHVLKPAAVSARTPDAKDNRVKVRECQRHW